MTLFATLIFLCWSILIISWIVTAISTKHTIESQNIKKRLVYGTLFFLNFCLLFEGVTAPANELTGIYGIATDAIPP
jgi:hypothetical protein